MEQFTFNNISSNSLGLIVKEMPLVPQAEKNIESIEVNGRNGNLHIDNLNYKSKEYTLVCILTDLSKLDEICSVLSGDGELMLSKYEDRIFKASILNQISFKSYGNYMQEFPILFELNPIAFSNQIITEEITENSSIDVEGNVEISPILEIIGIGSITINGYSLQVLESGITIDCDLMNCTKNNLNKNDKVVLDKFPKLTPGSNAITLGTGIEEIKVVYRKGWL